MFPIVDIDLAMLEYSQSIQEQYTLTKFLWIFCCTDHRGVYDITGLVVNYGVGDTTVYH